MANKTSIEWTDLSWNPVHGCSKVSPGCAHCYAEALSRRYRQTLKPWTPENASENVLLKPHKLREPFSGAKAWRGLGAAAAAAGKSEGKLVFVNSTSDLFHELVPVEFIATVFAVMLCAPQHTFQVLTKRPERMLEVLTGRHPCPSRHNREEMVDFPDLVLTHAFRLPVAVRERAGVQDFLHFRGGRGVWPLLNVWLGVSIENRRYVGRADVLRETPAAVRFISAEPLLGPLIAPHKIAVPNECDDIYPDAEDVVPFWGDQGGAGGPDELDLTGIDWLIVGGESGAGHRPMREEWVRDLYAARRGQPATAFFFKQMGGARPGGRLEDLPEGLRVREFPRCRR